MPARIAALRDDLKSARTEAESLRAELALAKAQLLAGKAEQLAGGQKILVEEVAGVDADSLKVKAHTVLRHRLRPGLIEGMHLKK